MLHSSRQSDKPILGINEAVFKMKSVRIRCFKRRLDLSRRILSNTAPFSIRIKKNVTLYKKEYL